MARSIAPGGDERAHGVDRMRRAPKIVAAVHEGQPPRDRLQGEGPVQRRIAAAHDHHVASAEILHAPHGIMHAAALVGLDAGDRRLLGLERAAAGRDHEGLAAQVLPKARAHQEQRCLRRAERLDRLDHLAEVEHRLERLALGHQLVDDLLAGDAGIAGNVVDRLLGVELRALAARLGQDVDEVATDVEQAELEHGEEPDRPGADDHHIRLDGLVARVVGHASDPWFRWC